MYEVVSYSIVVIVECVRLLAIVVVIVECMKLLTIVSHCGVY